MQVAKCLCEHSAQYSTIQRNLLWCLSTLRNEQLAY